MTQQLQLAIKLLALTNVELETYIGEELDKNPLLSTSDGADTVEAPAVPEAAIDPSRQGLDALLGKSGEGSGSRRPARCRLHRGGLSPRYAGGDSADWGAAPAAAAARMSISTVSPPPMPRSPMCCPPRPAPPSMAPS